MQAAIRLVTAVIKFRNLVRGAKKCKTCNLGYTIVSIYAINGQTNGQNYTNFESNLVMMVIYLPVKFEFD